MKKPDPNAKRDKRHRELSARAPASVGFSARSDPRSKDESNRQAVHDGDQQDSKVQLFVAGTGAGDERVNDAPLRTP